VTPRTERGTGRVAASTTRSLTWLARTKYGGRCRQCSAYIPAGTSAWWSPRTHALICTSCGPARSAAPTNATRDRKADGGAIEATDSAQGRWQRLVSYLRACVTAEAAGELAAHDDTSRWAVLGLGEERLVCGTADTILLTDELRSRFARLRPGEVLRYGWPVLAIPDRKGRLRLAPILVTDLAPPESDATSVGATEDEPYLNPGLLGADQIEPEAAEQLSALVVDGLPFGDIAAMSKLATAITQVVDDAAPAMDPRNLGSDVPGQPGVYNVAVVVQAESSVMTRSLLEELADLEHREDWRTTAAAHLVGLGPTPSTPPKRSLAASPLPLNDSQERVVDELRQSPLTVVTGPPGTGKSQVVVAAVSNAWLDDETVLLASTNNAAVDVATERATEVASPLLVRTGNKTFRDGLAGAIGTVLAEARSATRDEPAARRELALAAGARRELLAVIQRRQDLLASITRSSLAAEDASRRA